MPLRSAGHATGSIGPSESSPVVPASVSNSPSIQGRCQAGLRPAGPPPRPRPGLQGDLHDLRHSRADSPPRLQHGERGSGLERASNSGLLAAPMRAARRRRGSDTELDHGMSRGAAPKRRLPAWQLTDEPCGRPRCAAYAASARRRTSAGWRRFRPPDGIVRSGPRDKSRVRVCAEPGETIPRDEVGPGSRCESFAAGAGPRRRFSAMGPGVLRSNVATEGSDNRGP